MAARVLGGIFYALSLVEGDVVARRSEQNGYFIKYRQAAQSRFSPVSGPFWVRVGVRVRVRVTVRVRGWFMPTPVT